MGGLLLNALDFARSTKPVPLQQSDADDLVARVKRVYRACYPDDGSSFQLTEPEYFQLVRLVIPCGKSSSVVVRADRANERIWWLDIAGSRYPTMARAKGCMQIAKLFGVEIVAARTEVDNSVKFLRKLGFVADHTMGAHYIYRFG